MDVSDFLSEPYVAFGVGVIVLVVGGVCFSKRWQFVVAGYELSARDNLFVVFEGLYRYFKYSNCLRDREPDRSLSYESCLSIWQSTVLGLNDLDLGERIIALEHIRERIVHFIESQNGLGPVDDAGVFFLSLRRLTQDRRYPNALSPEQLQRRAKAISDELMLLANAAFHMGSRPV